MTTRLTVTAVMASMLLACSAAPSAPIGPAGSADAVPTSSPPATVPSPNEEPRRPPSTGGCPISLTFPLVDHGVPRDFRRLLLEFVAPKTLAETAALVAPFGLVLEDEQPVHIVNHTTDDFWVRSATFLPIAQESIAGLATALDASLRWIAPVYLMPGALPSEAVAPIPDVLLVEPAGSDEALAAFLANLGMVENALLSRYSGRYRHYEGTRCHTVFEIEPLLAARPDLAASAVHDHMPLIKGIDKQW